MKTASVKPMAAETMAAEALTAETMAAEALTAGALTAETMAAEALTAGGLTVETTVGEAVTAGATSGKATAAMAVSIAAAAALIGGAGCRPSSETRPAPTTAAAWPVLLGDGSASVSAMARLEGTAVVAGLAPHGLTVAGRTLSDVPGGYVLALDADAQVRWVRTLEGREGVVVDAVAAADVDTVVFAGHFEGHVRSGAFEVRSVGGRDCVMGKIGPDGGLRWLQRWGTSGTDLCRAVLATEARVWVAGSRPEASNAAADRSDVLLLQLDLASGEVLGERAFSGGGDDHGRALAINARGEVAVGGMYGGPYDPQGKRVVAAADTALRWGDRVVRPPARDYDAFVVVFDPEGDVVASTGWSTPGFDTVKHLVPASHAGSGWLVSGVHQPGLADDAGPGLAADDVPLGGIVVSLSPGGDERWRFAESALLSASAVAVASETIWVVGHARGPLGAALGRGVRGRAAAVVFGLDPSGALTRVVAACDGAAADQGHALVVSPAGGSLWWAGAMSLDAACVPGGSAHAGALFRAVLGPG